MSIQKRTSKAGLVRWVVRWRDPYGTEHSRSFPTRRAAVNWETAAKDIARAQAVPTLDGLLRVAVENASVSTARIYEHHRAQLGDLATVPVTKLTVAGLQAWATQLEQGRPWAQGKPLAPNTVVGVVRTVVRHIENAGKAGHDVVDARAALAKFLRTERRNLVLPSPQELAAFDAHPVPVWLRHAVVLAASTGLRIGEVAGLQWRDIDWERGTLRVERQGTARIGVYTAPKTASSVRTVPLGAGLLARLRVAHRERPGHVDGVTGPVIWGARGRGVSASTLGLAFDRWREHLGVREGVTFHTLRHGYATAMLEAGVALPTVSGLLGHSSADITARVYLHRTETQMGQARAVLDAVGHLMGQVVPESAPGANFSL